MTWTMRLRQRANRGAASPGAVHTDGRRIYTIGDIHGCLDALETVLGFVEADLTRAPHPKATLIFLGDYVDRGPDSRGVIDRLIGLRAGPLEAAFLIGNHDAMMLDFITPEPEGLGGSYPWLSHNIGGAATCRSYGVDPDGADFASTQAAMMAAVPPAHRGFLEEADLSVEIGAYLFVHAGIRPGVGIDDQDPQELVWIRGPFLDHSGPHPRIVVHGHTPVERVEHHGNRIAVDTGAVFGGTLSCLVLEGDEAAVLRPAGRQPLAPR